MPNKDWRLIEFGEQKRENVGIACGTDHLTGRRGGPEPGEVRSEGWEPFEAGSEVGTAPTPSVEGEYARWTFTEDLGEECTVCE
jgi:hypothetical protein